MGKHEFMTPKAIANRQKSKGLQKLRWYCQMCQKQCRDENGFKCHLTSEGHLRQMRIFMEHGDRIMSDFSSEFEKDFLDVLSRRHGTKRVRAVHVYNEFIADKHHVHMNSTRWVTLTNFVKYLGKQGICLVDQTEKGWYIQWIDRDPEVLRRQAESERRKKAELDEEEKQLKLILERVEVVQSMCKDDGSQSAPTEINRKEGDQKLELVLESAAASRQSVGGSASSKKRALSAVADLGFDVNDSNKQSKMDKGIHDSKGATKMSALDKIMLQEQRQKMAAEKIQQEALRKDYWLHPQIIVKIMNKKIKDGQYYKKKARVSKVIEKYVGEVVVLDSGDRLRIDQEQLETVVPAIGAPVIVLNGRYRGMKAELVELDIDNFCATLSIIEDGPNKGEVIKKVEYEDFSKLFQRDT